MSYTKHTWVDDETITAAKMNNIEDGVTSASGSNPLITFNFSGFASASYVFNFGIGELDDGVYVVKPLLINGDKFSLYDLYVVAPSGELIFPCPLMVPKKEGVDLLFFKLNSANFTTTVSGDISQNTVSATGWGSTGDAYIITGDCTINITAI